MPHGIDSLACHQQTTLQQDALGLWAEEVHENATDAAQTREQEEHAVDVEVREELHHLRHDGTHGPVSRRRQRHTRSAHAQREDLGRVDPAHRTPRDGEVEDEEGRAHADEPAADLGASCVVHVAVTDRREQNGGEQVTNDHADGTDEQKLATSGGVHPAHGRDGAQEVDTGDEEGRVDAGVGDVLEDETTVAHDRVDARGLLQHLQQHGDDDTLADGRLEQLCESLVGGLFLLDLVTDGLQLVTDVVRHAKPFEDLLGLILALVQVRPARTLRYEEDAEHDDERSSHGHTVGRTPATVVVLHDDIDDVGQEEPDDDGHLHEAREQTAQLLGGHLGAEERQREGRVAHAEALHHTGGVHEVVLLRLVEADPGRADAEEQAGTEDGGSTAELVGHEAANEGAAEAAEVVGHVVPDREVRPLRRQVRRGGDALVVREVVPADAVIVDERVHDEHARGHALVVAEEEAAQGGEDAHYDGVRARALGRDVVHVVSGHGGATKDLKTLLDSTWLRQRKLRNEEK
ncbi:unnamed protein product [Phytophthora fragariaefolia]|uniref:Unnamed protein product n=1 Tax=Phytophthora fragariaefolia TaxID=1490495 RepID=A0A9W7CW68_9STRA|nr:unnamed protein product [Phytophthora fragariaefolia]